MTYDQQPPLEEMTLRQLRRVASRYGVSRYSRMRKDQLLAAIIEAQQKSVTPMTAPHAQTAADSLEAQEVVEAAKFDAGTVATYDPTLASVDEGLGDLPDGYGTSRIVLMPRDPQWAFAYWDIPDEHKSELRAQGGQQLVLRLYDATDIDVNAQVPHSVQEYPCDELAREWYLPIPVSDRDYVIEIGYRTGDGRWLMLARSAQVRIPPTYPSDWIDDQFATVDWDSSLVGQSIANLRQPSRMLVTNDNLHQKMYAMVDDLDALRVAGSVYGSMQHGGIDTLSSYVFPSGVGLWAVPTASGISGLTPSGAGMFSASAAPARPRQFWLVADAELIVYGATEPDATVTIGDRKIDLNPDGTFRFQMSFQDGLIDYPIFAVAADGEQNREIHMKFTRETPARRTNTKAEAIEEWFV